MIRLLALMHDVHAKYTPNLMVDGVHKILLPATCVHHATLRVYFLHYSLTTENWWLQYEAATCTILKSADPVATTVQAAAQ